MKKKLLIISIISSTLLAGCSDKDKNNDNGDEYNFQTYSENIEESVAEVDTDLEILKKNNIEKKYKIAEVVANEEFYEILKNNSPNKNVKVLELNEKQEVSLDKSLIEKLTKFQKIKNDDFFVLQNFNYNIKITDKKSVIELISYIEEKDSISGFTWEILSFDGKEIVVNQLHRGIPIIDRNIHIFLDENNILDFAEFFIKTSIKNIQAFNVDFNEAMKLATTIIPEYLQYKILDEPSNVYFSHNKTNELIPAYSVKLEDGSKNVFKLIVSAVDGDPLDIIELD